MIYSKIIGVWSGVFILIMIVFSVLGTVKQKKSIQIPEKQKKLTESQKYNTVYESKYKPPPKPKYLGPNDTVYRPILIQSMTEYSNIETANQSKNLLQKLIEFTPEEQSNKNDKNPKYTMLKLTNHYLNLRFLEQQEKNIKNRFTYKLSIQLQNYMSDKQFSQSLNFCIAIRFWIITIASNLAKKKLKIADKKSNHLINAIITVLNELNYSKDIHNLQSLFINMGMVDEPIATMNVGSDEFKMYNTVYWIALCDLVAKSPELKQIGFQTMEMMLERIDESSQLYASLLAKSSFIELWKTIRFGSKVLAVAMSEYIREWKNIMNPDPTKKNTFLKYPDIIINVSDEIQKVITTKLSKTETKPSETEIKPSETETILPVVPQ